MPKLPNRKRHEPTRPGGIVTRGVVLIVAAALAGACATAKAAAVPSGPPLDVPEAPPRVVVDLPTDPPPAPAPPAAAPSGGGTRRPAPAPKSPVPPRPATETQASPAPPPLQLGPRPGEPAATVVSVKGSLAQTARRLDRVDRATLTAERQAQYDTARRFLDQAGTALTAGNLTFAHYLGEKAETLARDLVP